MSRFYVENFGCRATQADGAAIERQMLQRGLVRADDPQRADLVVLNSCTVTDSADHDVRSTIRRIHRGNPHCRILVTGCYAQRAPHELAALPGVSWVVGNSHKNRVAELACGTTSLVALDSLTASVPLSRSAPPQAGSAAGIMVGDIFAHTELLAAPVFDAAINSEKTRPNLKVQDGCNNRCSFCIIPSVRGRSRSLPLEEVVREMNALVAMGYREVVISGINLGRWGRDLLVADSTTRPRPGRIVDLLGAILDRTKVERLRISSVEPMDWSDELIALVATCDRIAKHAHVPMQSGSDRVLRQMHRKYRPWHYAEKIRSIRAAMPSAAIGADVMVGFPGETDADFEQTRAMVEELPFTYLHVFTYSQRPGTPAAAMKEQVPGPEKRDRNRILRELAAQKKAAFQRSFVGETLSAVTLSISDDHATEALTENYLKMRLPGRHQANQFVNARVLGISQDTLVGMVVAEQNNVWRRG